MKPIDKCVVCKREYHNSFSATGVCLGDRWYCISCLKCSYDEECISKTGIFICRDGRIIHPECHLRAEFVKKFGHYDQLFSLAELDFLIPRVKRFQYHYMYEKIRFRLRNYNGNMYEKLRTMTNPIEIYQLIVSYENAMCHIAGYLREFLDICRYNCQTCKHELGKDYAISTRNYRPVIHTKCAKCITCAVPLKEDWSGKIRLPFQHAKCTRCPCGKPHGILIIATEQFWHVECYLPQITPDWHTRFLRVFIPEIVHNRRYSLAVDFEPDIPDIEIKIIRNLNLRDAIMFMSVFRVPINSARLIRLLKLISVE